VPSPPLRVVVFDRGVADGGAGRGLDGKPTPQSVAAVAAAPSLAADGLVVVQREVVFRAVRSVKPGKKSSP
jgi:hypothetical protein